MMCGYYAVAQDYPKAEVFGGFSIAHLDTEGAQSKLGLPSTFNIKTWYPGWEIAGQYNLTKMFGIKADFTGNYGKPLSVTGAPPGLPSARAYSFLFGPVVSFRGDHITPFVHALFGGNHASVDASALVGNPAISDTAFAMAIGGGLDWKLTHHFAVRVGQFDYLYTKHDACSIVAGAGGIPVGAVPACEAMFPAHQNNFRFATGIVIH
jgi:opacity protein-like surface antigen